MIGQELGKLKGNLRIRYRKPQTNTFCKNLWSRIVLRESVVLLGSQVMKGAINGDEDTQLLNALFASSLSGKISALLMI